MSKVETTLGYGEQELKVRLPQNCTTLKLQEPSRSITPGRFSENLQEYFRTTPLDLSRTILIVADKTRLCGYPQYLPPLLSQLEEMGMDRKNLLILIAYGTHPHQSKEECLEAYGEVYKTYQFLHHSSDNRAAFVDLGTSSRGTPIRFRKELLDATCIITMGAVCHHYFAGYGGGRKLIFPGCGEKQSIYANHGLYLDRDSRTLAPKCQPGVLTGNPLAEDLFEIEDKLPADLAIHGILNSKGQLCDLVVGKGRDTFLRACQLHGDNCEISSRKFGTVVGSCGGFPKDINFIQSHKAIHNAAMYVADGGLLLLYCECRDQIGSATFLPWFKIGSFAEAFAQLSQNYEGNGGTALALMTKLQRIRIGLITDLDEKICNLIGVEKWSHQMVRSHLDGLNPDHQTAFIPNASLLVKIDRP